MSISDEEAHQWMARQRAVRNMWHEKKGWIKCRVTRCCIKVVAAKKMEMVKRSMRLNWKMK